MPDADVNDPIPNAATEVSDPDAARAEFLHNPPAFVPTDEPVVVDDEAAALDELTKPPAATGSTAEGQAPTAPAAGTPDPYAEFGGVEAVRNAHAVAEALRTETGVRLLIAQGLEALGHSPDQIRRALAREEAAGNLPTAEPAVPADPYANLDDDDVVDGATFKAALARATQDAAAQAAAAVRAQVEPLAAQQLQQQVAAQNARNDATLAEVLGPVPTDPAELAAYQTTVTSILQAAGQYITPDTWDPTAIRSAIVTAHAAYEAAEEAKFQRFLQNKRKARQAAPANIGGHSPGEAPEPEPKTMAEASAMARKSGLFG